MARYKLLEKAYINGAVREPGEEVVVGEDVIPGPHMAPLDKAARAATEAAAGRGPVPGDPDYIGSMIDHYVNDGATEGKVRVTSAPAPGVVVDEAGVVRGLTAEPAAAAPAG